VVDFHYRARARRSLITGRNKSRLSLSGGGGYLFLVATSVFAAAFVYQRSLVDQPVGGRFATGGIVGGLLAFGCPICNAVLLALFSSSALMTYFDPDRPLLGVLSVAGFGLALYYQRTTGCETC